MDDGAVLGAYRCAGCAGEHDIQSFPVFLQHYMIIYGTVLW